MYNFGDQPLETNTTTTISHIFAVH